MVDSGRCDLRWWSAVRLTRLEAMSHGRSSARTGGHRRGAAGAGTALGYDSDRARPRSGPLTRRRAGPGRVGPGAGAVAGAAAGARRPAGGMRVAKVRLAL